MVVHAGSGHNGDHFVMACDPGSARGQFAFDPLEDVHIPTSADKHVGNEKPANRAADYDSPPLLAPAAFCLRSVTPHRALFLVRRTQPR
jgi:hypothetical protein